MQYRREQGGIRRAPAQALRRVLSSVFVVAVEVVFGGTVAVEVVCLVALLIFVFFFPLLSMNISS